MSIAAELTRLILAINELEDARKTCEYDQGYFLNSEITEVEAAEHDFIVSGSDNP